MTIFKTREKFIARVNYQHVPMIPPRPPTPPEIPANPPTLEQQQVLNLKDGDQPKETQVVNTVTLQEFTQAQQATRDSRRSVHSFRHAPITEARPSAQANPHARQTPNTLNANETHTTQFAYNTHLSQQYGWGQPTHASSPGAHHGQHHQRGYTNWAQATQPAPSTTERQHASMNWAHQPAQVSSNANLYPHQQAYAPQVFASQASAAPPTIAQPIAVGGIFPYRCGPSPQPPAPRASQPRYLAVPQAPVAQHAPATQPVHYYGTAPSWNPTYQASPAQYPAYQQVPAAQGTAALPQAQTYRKPLPRPPVPQASSQSFVAYSGQRYETPSPWQPSLQATQPQYPTAQPMAQQAQQYPAAQPLAQQTPQYPTAQPMAQQAPQYSTAYQAPVAPNLLASQQAYALQPAAYYNRPLPQPPTQRTQAVQPFANHQSSLPPAAAPQVSSHSHAIAGQSVHNYAMPSSQASSQQASAMPTAYNYDVRPPHPSSSQAWQQAPAAQTAHSYNMPLAQQSGPQTWQQASATPTTHTYDVRSPHPSNPQTWQQPQSAHGYSTSSQQPPGPQAQQQESPDQPAQYHQPTSSQPSAGQTPVQTETDPVPQRLELPSAYHELRSMTTDSRTQEFLGTLEALPSVESLVGPRHSTSVTMRMAQYLLREEEEEQRKGMGGPPAD